MPLVISIRLGTALQHVFQSHGRQVGQYMQEMTTKDVSVISLVMEKTIVQWKKDLKKKKKMILLSLRKKRRKKRRKTRKTKISTLVLCAQISGMVSVEMIVNLAFGHGLRMMSKDAALRKLLAVANQRTL